MYAVIRAGGKQYRVSEGDVITVSRLKGNAGDPIEFNKVLMLEKDGLVRAFSDSAEEVKVTGKILKQGQGKKIRVFRYRRRKNWMRTTGSRPKLTSVAIEKIIS